MTKVISQDTFDDVVKENIVDFSMSPDEAKEETIKQFEAQGISLSNIIKDLTINKETGKPVLNEAVEKLKKHLGEQAADTEALHEYLNLLDEECQKSIAHRVLAGKNGAHDALVTLLESETAKTKPNVEILKKTLQALNSLTSKQPDLFDAEALAVLLRLLKEEVKYKNEDITCLGLQWLQKACIMHEMNRQNIINGGIISVLKPLLRMEPRNLRIYREVLTLVRYLVLDDDVRVEFGNAHEHARQLANEFVVDLTKMLTEIEDTNILADLLLTIGTLAVRQEICKTIDDADGLKSIFNIMIANPEAVRVNREALKLLRALAGHDAIKVHIVEQGMAPIARDLLQTHMTNENMAVAVLGCVSTLTLRIKNNSTAFFETGIAEIIVETVRQHPKNRMVQRNAAWTIRNMVSRSREQCETWLSFGIEDLLNQAKKEHPNIETDVKAALRDLGCNVELKEEWTGKAEKKITS